MSYGSIDDDCKFKMTIRDKLLFAGFIASCGFILFITFWS